MPTWVASSNSINLGAADVGAVVKYLLYCTAGGFHPPRQTPRRRHNSSSLWSVVAWCLEDRGRAFLYPLKRSCYKPAGQPHNLSVSTLHIQTHNPQLIPTPIPTPTPSQSPSSDAQPHLEYRVSCVLASRSAFTVYAVRSTPAPCSTSLSGHRSSSNPRIYENPLPTPALGGPSPNYNILLSSPLPSTKEPASHSPRPLLPVLLHCL